MPITIAHAKSDTIADYTGTITQFNATGGTATVAATDLVRPSDWNSAHSYTLSLTASEIQSIFNFGTGLTSSTAAGGISVGLGSVNWFEPFPMLNTASSNSTDAVNSWYIDGPYVIDYPLNSGQLMNLVSQNSSQFRNAGVYSAASTGGVSRYMTLWNNWAIYKQGTGASTSRLESVWTNAISLLATHSMSLGTANTSSGTISNALTLSFPSQYDMSGNVTYSTASVSGSSAFGTSTAASTYGDNLITSAQQYVTGQIAHLIPFNTQLQPGLYWFGRMWNSSSSTTGTAGGIGAAGTVFGSLLSRLGLEFRAANGWRRIGQSTQNGSTNVQPFAGNLRTTATSATNIINTGDMSVQNTRAYFNIFASTY